MGARGVWDMQPDRVGVAAITIMVMGMRRGASRMGVMSSLGRGRGSKACSSSSSKGLGVQGKARARRRLLSRLPNVAARLVWLVRRVIGLVELG